MPAGAPSSDGYQRRPSQRDGRPLCKEAAEDQTPSAPPHVLATTSLAHIARTVTQAKRRDRDAWLAKHCMPKGYYKRPKGINKVAFKTKKSLAARFFQLRLQKAPTAPYLHKTGRRPDDSCWCALGDRPRPETICLRHAESDATSTKCYGRRWRRPPVKEEREDERQTRQSETYWRMVIAQRR